MTNHHWCVIRTLLLFFCVGLVNAQRERWVYRHNGPADGSDCAHSVVYGLDGNIYCAGMHSIPDSSEDFVVVSLNSSGGERWIHSYHGVGVTASRALSIVYGSDSNLYATGWISSSDTSSDFVVVGLTASGTERWVYKNDKPGRGQAVLYGPDGCIYAAGSGESLTVVCLARDGSERWVYRYQGPGGWGGCGHSIVCGSDSNIYVAGGVPDTNNAIDLAVVSLNRSGGERWVYTYDGAFHGHDEAFTLALDSVGNVYAGGWSQESLFYYFDFIVISLTATGQKRWIYHCPTANQGIYLEMANSVLYGPDGYIYAAGSIYGSDSLPSFAVVSLTSSGGERWRYMFNRPGWHKEVAYSMVYGLDSNLYVAGEITDTITSGDFTVISLTPQGLERWIYKYGSTGRINDYAFSLVFGPDRNIYCAGSLPIPIRFCDFGVVSLDPRVGVEEKATRNIQRFPPEIYPNPNQGKIILQMANSVGQRENRIEIRIFDICGKLIKEEKLIDCKGEARISLQGMSAGVYFIRAKVEDKELIEKIVVTR